MNRSNRRALAVAVLALWGLALGWLIRRQFFAEPAEHEAAGWPVPPGAAFYGVYRGALQVGLASITVDTLPEGLKVTAIRSLDLPRLPGADSRRLATRTEAIFSRSLRLRHWRTELLEDGDRSATEGAVEGDTALVLITRRAQAAETLRVAVAGPVVLPEAIPFRLHLAPERRPGTRYDLLVFDPLAQRLRTVAVLIGGDSLFVVADSATYDSTLTRWVTAHSDTVRAWQIETTSGGAAMTQWVDAQGMIVGTSTPLGLREERAAFEVVNGNYQPRKKLGNWRGTAPALGLRWAPLPAKGPTPRVERLVLRLSTASGPLPPSAPVLEGGFQHRSGDTLTIATTPAVGGVPPPDSATRAAYLAPEPLELRNDSLLRVTVGRIIGGERQPDVIATRLTDWVRRTVALTPGGGAGESGMALVERRGTSADRVALLVALARAAGLPARRVSGLLWLDGRFYLHGWAELALADWVPADPAFPGVPADARRVRLLVDVPARLAVIAPLVAQLQAEVLGPAVLPEPQSGEGTR